MGKTVKSKKRNPVTIKIANDEFSYVDGIDEITLEKATDCWYFKSELGYIVSSADAVDVNVKENISDPETKANISFNKSKYTVTITFGTSKKVLTFGGSYWGMYASTTATSNPTKLYKKVVTGNLKSTTLSFGDYANKTFSFTNGVSDDTFTTPTATVTPAEATGAVKYTSSDNDIVTVADNGELSFTNKKFGSADISAQFIATGDYANSNIVKYTVENKELQKTATTVTFGDMSQQTITLTEGDVTGVVFPKASEKNNIAGTVSYESSNTDVAVVDADGNVTINGAYGESTITATFTPSGETYAVSTDWYKVVNKVNAAFYESFDKCAGKGGNDGAFKNTGKDKVLSDNTEWSFTNEYGANKCVKLGSSGKSGSAETPAINLSGKGLLTFKVASWVGDNSEVNVSVDNGTLIYNGKEGKSFVLSPTDTEWNDINMIISMTGSVKVKFYSTNKRFFLDEVMVKDIPTVTLDETATNNTIEAKSGVNVTLKRTMVANEWNTICLPFDVTYDKAKAAFGDNVKIVELDTKAAVDANVLSFKASTGIVAATPYLIKPSAVADEYTFENVDITNKAADYSTTANVDVAFKGIYNMVDITKDVVEFGATYYAAFLGADNKIYKAKSNGNKTKGFRAYFAIPKSASASALRVVIDGTATSIKNIDSEVVESNAPVYNLQGQRVDGNNLTPGIYVKAGKKFVVK
ncbi:hypothetical protein [Prevotella sp.]|uniref:hypothetical protein n=1 Tax=Prevotella sp. TaxID=59823 RepID=UPI002E75A536|nr:hypothetical protein [Prevotella sp.]MEE0669891.1 hypothetical protein [Prevotella sp.]